MKRNFIEELLEMFESDSTWNSTESSALERQETVSEAPAAEVPEQQEKVQEQEPSAYDQPKEEQPAKAAKERVIDDPKKLIIFSEIMKPKF